LEKNPSYTEWKYRVISIRLDKANDALSEQVYKLLSTSGKPPQELAEELKKLNAPENAIAISNESTAKDQELSELHKASITNLRPARCCTTAVQASRIDKKTVYRIFYLIDKSEPPAPSFEDLAKRLNDDLIQKAA